MKSTTTMMVKGLGIGMAVGGVAAMLSTAMMNPSLKRQTRKNTLKAMKTFNGMLDSVQNMMK